MSFVRRVLAGAAALAMTMEPLGLTKLAVYAESATEQASVAAATEPELTVNIPNADKWTNSIADWVISVNVPAKIYFATDKNDKQNWGEYTSGQEWKSDSTVPEGENYIKFWAVPEDEQYPVIEKDAVKYRFDSIIPAYFGIIEKEGILTQDQGITDERSDVASGIAALYYTFGDVEIKSLDDLKNKATKLSTKKDKDNKETFSLKLKSYYELATVRVFAVDNAGNYREAGNKSITSNTAAPNINVSNFESDKWYNDNKNWTFTTDWGAKLYWKVSDEDLADWGEMSEAKTGDLSPLDTGTGYIHFWAAYNNPLNQVKETTYSYKIDKESPADFEVTATICPGAEDGSTWGHARFTASGITDEGPSGIESISYTIQHEGMSEGNEIFLTQDQFSVGDDGKASFTVDLFDDLKGETILFKVKDKAGNSTEYACEGVSNDPNIPVILTGNDQIGIVERTKKDASEEEMSVIKPIQFGCKTVDDLLKLVYANDSDFLKLTIREKELNEIRVYVDNAKVPISFAKTESDSCKSWISFFAPDENGEAVYYIRLSELGLTPDKEHTLFIDAKDNQNTSAKVGLKFVDKPDGEADEYKLFYDPYSEDADTVVSIEPDVAPTVSGAYNYYGKGYQDRSFNIDISDDNGLAGYIVDVNGQVIDSADYSDGAVSVTTCTSIETVVDESGCIVTDEDGDPVTTAVYYDEEYIVPVTAADTINVSLADEIFERDGSYEIRVKASDLAGNKSREDNSVYRFMIDTMPPEVDRKFEYDKALLHLRRFGLFGSRSVSITIHAKDLGVGIDPDTVVLHWAPKKSNILEEYKAEKTGDDAYTFRNLPVGGEAVPYITISDLLGNTSRYYFYIPESEKESCQVISSEMLGNNNRAVLVLENDIPVVNILIPDSYSETSSSGDELKMYSDKDGIYWYPVGIKYQVSAVDKNSGLEKVVVKQNGKEYKTEESIPEAALSSDAAGKYNAENGVVSFAENRFRDEARYSYPLIEEGKYKLEASASDNAGNSITVSPVNIGIDLNLPEITQFVFGGISGDATSYTRDTFGFFFNESTEARVYIKDDGVSSGFNNVTFCLENVDGTNDQFVAGPAFASDENGQYAKFTIPMGFKGRVIAKVTDNVGHSSGLISADGSVVEDQGIHENSSGLDIKPDIQNRGTDANGVPLYNSSIPLTVTAEDSFSGIALIEWSIANDNESGRITVDVDGSYSSDSEAAVIDEESVKYDSNLVTLLKFKLSVDSNTNGNTVRVKLTDRAGNTSVSEKVYSVDTTPPVISSELSNQDPSNGKYYNTDQTVKITVVERNFDPDSVKVVVNNVEQSINWGGEKKSIGTDETVHTGEFKLTADGDYNYTISYNDMAGNTGNTFSEPSFVIDRTAPTVTNNFETFGDPEKNDKYFNLNNKASAKAVITVDEVNFYPADIGVQVFCKPAGSPHTDDGWTTYYYKAEWETKKGTNLHTLTIQFEEDYVYKVVMSPSDRAGNKAVFKIGDKVYPNNTAIFEADFTAPVICERNGNIVKSNDVAFMDLYDYERRLESAPKVVFVDTNIDHISYKIHKYTPVYENGKNIGMIEPADSKGTVKEFVEDSTDRMFFSLPGFEEDGVYSAKLIAYDKAGNASELNDNTYVRMIDPSTKVLAFIENSDSENGTGWYSIENGNGPISKQPDSFSDLDIVVFSKYSAESRVLLVDKNTDTVTDTEITSDENSLFDKDMYGIGAYRYTLPGSYFSDNYTADADTNLYLQVENAGVKSELGEIYIDNTDPRCDVPGDFRNWGYFSSSGTKTLHFDNVSEALDIEQTVAYVDGKTISISSHGVFRYDEACSRISLDLEPGKHTVGILLVDKAKNTNSVQEVQHLAIGVKGLWQNYWFIPIILLAGIAAIVGGIFLNKAIRRR